VVLIPSLCWLQVDWDGKVALIQCAKALGIQRYVFFSIHNCDKHPEVPLMEIKRCTEAYLADSGLDYTVLRLCGFMQVGSPASRSSSFTNCLREPWHHMSYPTNSSSFAAVRLIDSGHLTVYDCVGVEGLVSRFTQRAVKLDEQKKRRLVSVIRVSEERLFVSVNPSRLAILSLIVGVLLLQGSINEPAAPFLEEKAPNLWTSIKRRALHFIQSRIPELDFVKYLFWRALLIRTSSSSSM
jgi:hypothetical protein